MPPPQDILRNFLNLNPGPDRVDLRLVLANVNWQQLQALDAPGLANPVPLFAHSIKNLLLQNISLGANIWRQIFHYYDGCVVNNGFKDKAAEIGFMLFYAYSMTDANQAMTLENQQLPPEDAAERRNNLFEDDLLELLLRLSAGVVVTNFSIDLVKKYMLRPPIKEAIKDSIRELHLHDVNTARLDDNDWWQEMINSIKFYAGDYGLTFRGATISDGILINRFFLRYLSDNRLKAYLVTLLAHEIAHYGVRYLIRNLGGFSTPTSYLTPGTGPRRDVVHPNIFMELGRSVEYKLFGNVQPDWTYTHTQTAIEFLWRILTRHQLPVLTVEQTGVTIPALQILPVPTTSMAPL